MARRGAPGGRRERVRVALPARLGPGVRRRPGARRSNRRQAAALAGAARMRAHCGTSRTHRGPTHVAVDGGRDLRHGADRLLGGDDRLRRPCADALSGRGGLRAASGRRHCRSRLADRRRPATRLRVRHQASRPRGAGGDRAASRVEPAADAAGRRAVGGARTSGCPGRRGRHRPRSARAAAVVRSCVEGVGQSRISRHVSRVRR